MIPALPSPDRMALLLDIDGTLLDFAPMPEAVVVPPALPTTLQALRGRLGGALGFITGRPIAQVDALFPGVPTAVAGEHGAAIRHQPDDPVVRVDLPQPPPSWLATASALATAHPGALLERKLSGFVVHFRRAPEAGDPIGAALRALVGDAAGPFRLLPANMAWEVKPSGVHKGTALRALMDRAPFRGRVPVFVGDDVTDHDAIAAAAEMGGVGLLVGDHFTGPAAVRGWLADLP